MDVGTSDRDGGDTSCASESEYLKNNLQHILLFCLECIVLANGSKKAG